MFLNIYIYHIFEVSCPIGKIFMNMGEPNENLQYFLDSKNKKTTTKKEEQDELVQGKK
jgi:hypothetical protein